MDARRKSRAAGGGATFARMAKQEPGKVGRRTATGLVHVTMVLDPRHVAALKVEADRRAAAVESRKPDSSAVLRDLLDEVLDGWIAKQARRKP